MNRPEYQDLIRMSDAGRRELLNRVEIDGAEAGEARGKDQQDKRRDRRWSYRDRSIAVAVEHLAGGVSRYLTTPRNISAGGLAFLHGGYLHKGSKCRVDLVRLDGKTVSLVGHVAACRHVEGTVHEIGLKFDQIVDPAQFVRMPGDESRQDEHQSEQVSFEVPNLNDDILYVADSKEELKLLGHQLRSTGINLSTATTPNEAKRLVKAKPFDIVLCDHHLKGYDGIDLIKSLREHGFKGPIALVINEAEADLAAQAKTVGASQVLVKPYTPERLMELMVVLNAEASVVRKATAAFDKAKAAVPNAPVVEHRKAG